MNRLWLLILAPLLVTLALAQNDAEYAARVKEYTTDPHFLTEYVDHLPASPTIPSPLKFFGTVIGAPGVLHYSDEINKYMRALAASSDRVKVESMGKSEEGREMIVVLVSDAANLARIDDIKKINQQLSDPRLLVEGGYKGDGQLTGADEKAEKLIGQTLPIYYATGGMHSPESGPPEMLMELAYRLATEESPYIQEIRKNSIVMITPVLETDGRDRYFYASGPKRRIRPIDEKVMVPRLPRVHRLPGQTKVGSRGMNDWIMTNLAFLPSRNLGDLTQHTVAATHHYLVGATL